MAPPKSQQSSCPLGSAPGPVRSHALSSLPSVPGCPRESGHSTERSPLDWGPTPRSLDSTLPPASLCDRRTGGPLNMCWSGTLGLPPSLASADSTPHLWRGGWGGGSSQARSAGSAALGLGLWPAACFPGGPLPPRFGALRSSAEKASASTRCFLRSPPPSGLVTGCVSVAQQVPQLLCLPGPWVGGRKGPQSLCPPFAPPMFVISLCFSADRFLHLQCALSICLYSTASPGSAVSRFLLFPPPQPSPPVCSSLASSLSLHPPGVGEVGVGEGEGSIPPTLVSGPQHRSRGSLGRAGRQDPRPQA